MNWTFPLYKINEPIDWNALEDRFEWFRDMIGVPQDRLWHAEGDVFVHTKMVVEALLALPEFRDLDEVEKHILFASAMLHDVEKRSTTTEEVIDGQTRIVSPRHAKKGAFTARQILYKDIPTPFQVREQIVSLVRLHGLPLWAIDKNDPAKEVIKASLRVDTRMLSMLAKADVLGRVCQDKEDILLKIELFNELCMDNNCFGKSKSFPSNYGRFLYLNREGSSPDYVPYDDLKFTVHMVCGLPGSGKDTYIKRELDMPMLSLDEIRREHKIEPSDRKKNGWVIQQGIEQAKVFMRKRTSFVFNATNITADMRGKWVSLFTEYGGRVKIIYLEVPYKSVLKQNSNREWKVPESVVNKLLAKLEVPTFEEAHEVEYVVNY